MRVLLVQPPRCYWPYVSAEDNYLVQQALPALAAVARRDGHEVKVLDCLPMRMGWKTLHQEIKDFKPDVIGCGEKQHVRCFAIMEGWQILFDCLQNPSTWALLHE